MIITSESINQLRDKIRSPVWDQVWYKLEDLVFDYISVQIRLTVWNNVWIGVWNQLFSFSHII